MKQSMWFVRNMVAARRWSVWLAAASVVAAAGPAPPALAQAESVIVDLSRLKPSDEFKQFVSRKKAQLAPPADFKLAMGQAAEAMKRADANHGDHAAVDQYYGAIKTGLLAWAGHLEAFAQDEEQGARLIGELRRQYDKTAEDSEQAVKAYLGEAEKRGLETADVERMLDRITDGVRKFNGPIDDQRADLIIRLIVAEAQLPAREKLAIARAMKARVAAELARYCLGQLDKFNAGLARRYAVARGQLAMVPDIAELHAMGIENEQLRRMVGELTEAIGVFGDGSLALDLPDFVLGGLAEPPVPANGTVSAGEKTKSEFAKEQLMRRGERRAGTKAEVNRVSNP